MASLTRRSVLKCGTAAVLSLARPQLTDARERIVMNDASRLNPTPVSLHWIADPDPEEAFIARLRTELKQAVAERRPVAVGAARHSMGGQSLPRNGMAISFNSSRCVADPDAGIYRVQAGARWRDVIAALDPIGFSPAVMQSNNDFGVASTYSVNAHGWPVPYGPFGATVRSLRLMLADGSIITCSRSENAELFGLATGGYGLFGIILDLEVEMVPNVLLEPRYEAMASSEFAQRFLSAITDDTTVRMAYGRLSLSRSDFFEEALLATYRPVPTPSEGLPSARSSTPLTNLSRWMYRAQVGLEGIKQARWFAERTLAPALTSGIATRNTLMNEPAANLAGGDSNRTDILHEYFVPPHRFADFVATCREIILTSQQEFLNVTLRYVGPDEFSTLAYAPQERIAAVMSFSQEITAEAEADMMVMTESLIDRVIALGGSFYLPYRLHARVDQIERAYPRLGYFLDRKRHYDPRLLFRNLMWDMYFAG